jgi:hypothetical protein
MSDSRGRCSKIITFWDAVTDRYQYSKMNGLQDSQRAAFWNVLDREMPACLHREVTKNPTSQAPKGETAQKQTRPKKDRGRVLDLLLERSSGLLSETENELSAC